MLGKLTNLSLVKNGLKRLHDMHLNSHLRLHTSEKKSLGIGGRGHVDFETFFKLYISIFLQNIVKKNLRALSSPFELFKNKLQFEYMYGIVQCT